MTTNIKYGIFPALEVGNTELSISELPKAPSCDDALGPAYRGYKTVTHRKISLFFLLKMVRLRIIRHQRRSLTHTVLGHSMQCTQNSIHSAYNAQAFVAPSLKLRTERRVRSYAPAAQGVWNIRGRAVLCTLLSLRRHCAASTYLMVPYGTVQA
ncbi:UNVERIFIED_CONTAM: hypothetical protein FKN15_016763 [Acipenser sinensis]